MAMICIRIENIRADSRTSHKSATTDRGATKPAAAPRACKKRANKTASILLAMAAITEAAQNKAIPSSKGKRRPKRSSKGPYKPWPMASPNKKTESDCCTRAGSTANTTVTVGKAGKYKSMAIASSAVKSDKSKINDQPKLL